MANGASVVRTMAGGSRGAAPESAGRVLLHRRQRVRVDVQCRGDLLVAEPLLHDVRGDARLEQQRGGGMPEPWIVIGRTRAALMTRANSRCPRLFDCSGSPSESCRP